MLKRLGKNNIKFNFIFQFDYHRKIAVNIATKAENGIDRRQNLLSLKTFEMMEIQPF